jgi:hypothetical protein
MRSGFVFKLLRYYLFVRIFVASGKILSFVMLIMYRSKLYYVSKRACRRNKLLPCLLLPVNSLALSSASWRWVARNVMRFGGQTYCKLAQVWIYLLWRRGCYRIVEVPLRFYLKSHGIYSKFFKKEFY